MICFSDFTNSCSAYCFSLILTWVTQAFYGSLESPLCPQSMWTCKTDRANCAGACLCEVPSPTFSGTLKLQQAYLSIDKNTALQSVSETAHTSHLSKRHINAGNIKRRSMHIYVDTHTKNLNAKQLYLQQNRTTLHSTFRCDSLILHCYQGFQFRRQYDLARRALWSQGSWGQLSASCSSFSCLLCSSGYLHSGWGWVGATLSGWWLVLVPKYCPVTMWAINKSATSVLGLKQLSTADYQWPTPSYLSLSWRLNFLQLVNSLHKDINFWYINYQLPTPGLSISYMETVHFLQPCYLLPTPRLSITYI